MVQVETEETNFLSGKFVNENDVDELEILTEFEDQTSEFDGKEVTRLAGQVKCNDKDSSEKAWSMSKTNKNMLIEIFGNDTKNWVGKKLVVNCPKVNTPSGMQFSVQVDERRTKKNN